MIEIPDYPDTSCNRLTFSATVILPQAPGIFSLRVGEFLEIRATPFRGGLEQAMLYREDLPVGAVGGDLVSKLNQCLSKGNHYVASVASIVGGVVVVTVM